MAESITIPTTDQSVTEEKVKKWYLANKGKYNEFKKQADGIGKMNFTFFMNLMKFFSDCIPKDKLDICSYIFRLGHGDINFLGYHAADNTVMRIDDDNIAGELLDIVIGNKQCE